MGVEIAIGNTRLPVTIAAGVSVDWYRTSFAADASALDFELGGEETAQLALGMLELDGWERILDLACATGDRTRRRFEHVDSDSENLRAFERAARALRPGGRLLMQTPDVLHVEAHLPERTWFQVGETIELMCLHEVFGGDGRPWDASGAEPEIYVEARG